MIDTASQPGSVEWLLNALWLLLTVAAACSAYRRRPPRAKLREHAIALVALGCAATIAFPAISVSDDLYAQQWAMEDSGLRIKKPEQSAGSVTTPQIAVPHLLLALGSSPALQVVGSLRTVESARAPFWYVLPTCVRGPPQAASKLS